MKRVIAQLGTRRFVSCGLKDSDVLKKEETLEGYEGEFCGGGSWRGSDEVKNELLWGVCQGVVRVGSGSSGVVVVVDR